jgi:hypothetical protein
MLSAGEVPRIAGAFGLDTSRLTGERDNLKTKANELQKSRQALEQDFKKKQMENEKLKETTGYKNIQRMSDSLVVAYNKVTANKIAFLYESLDKTSGCILTEFVANAWDAGA